MACKNCPKATSVFTGSGMYYDCAAIHAMNLPNAPLAHQSYHVMTYMNQVFIPKECPYSNVSNPSKSIAISQYHWPT